MNKVLTLILFLLSINLQSQTTIEEFKPPKNNAKIILPPIIPYDSLTCINIIDGNSGYYEPIKTAEAFHQNNKYIGQKIFLTPNSDVFLYTKKRTKYRLNEIDKTVSPIIETYIYCPSAKKIDFHNIIYTSDSVSNRYFTISNFYYNHRNVEEDFYSTFDSILNISKHEERDVLYNDEDYRSSVSIVELIDEVSGDIVYSLGIDPKKWISTGYYEKLKQLFVGKEIIFSKLANYEFISKKDNVSDIGKVFLCTGIKYRNIHEKWANIDYIFIAKNNNAEIFFDFEYLTKLETFDVYGLFNNTDRFKNLISKQYKIEGENKFILMDLYNKMKKIDNKENLDNTNIQKQDKLIIENNKKNIIKKYGQNYGQHINKGEVIIGMNKAMCSEAWESLYEIVQQTKTEKGLIEVWENTYNNTRVYFLNGIVYKIQNL